jgi:polyphosphate:AMP phosphotransferase
MFKDTKIDSESISKSDFEAQISQLRVDLINAQFDLTKANFSVLILLVGNDRAGVDHVADRINEWMDARYIDTRIFGAPYEEEQQRPRFWRYWNALPAQGRTGLYGGAWPLNIIADRVNRKFKKKDFDRWIERANQLEQKLTDDGTLVLKFWVNLPRKALKARLKAAKKDPDRSWSVGELDWQVFERYAEIAKPINKFIEATDTEYAPWNIIDGSDGNYRDLKIVSSIRDAIVERLAAPEKEVHAAEVPGTYPDLLGEVDLLQSLGKKEYNQKLDKYQRRFHRLMRQAHEAGISPVLAFEGWDAGGKGGTIRRLTNALPSRSYRVIPIAAPTSEEKARHYLWRFWRQLPRAGNAVIFDRTWYGRVTVERIEGFATDEEWQRAYKEINDFEEQLAERGMMVLKFWLHISNAEQLTRFQSREVTDYKKYKITDEDYRNREKWDDYVLAVNEMIAKTSTPQAPWHIVPANDKRFARIFVLQTVCDALEKALDKR